MPMQAAVAEEVTYAEGTTDILSKVDASTHTTSVASRKAVSWTPSKNDGSATHVVRVGVSPLGANDHSTQNGVLVFPSVWPLMIAAENATLKILGENGAAGQD